MKHWPYGKKKPVMKHNESLGRTTKIAKIASLTLFIFVNWLKKSKDLEFFFTMLCSVRDLDAKHRRASIHWARSRAAFLKVLTTCFNDEIIIKKRIYTHRTPTQKKQQKNIHTICVKREWNRETVQTVHCWSAPVKPLYTVWRKREPWSAQSTRGPWTTVSCFAGNQRHICGRLHHTAICVWSRRNIIIIIVESSEPPVVFWKIERVWGVGSPRNAGTFLFNQTKKKVLRYHESAALSAGGFPLHLGDICQVASKLLSVFSSLVVFTDSSTLRTTSRWEPAGTGRKRPLCWG